MSDFQAGATVNADERALFDYLSDIGNLPDYVARMTSARPGDRQEVHTTAQTPDGQHVGATPAHRIAWGSEGPHDLPRLADGHRHR